jgi:hypothetical protein
MATVGALLFVLTIILGAFLLSRALRPNSVRASSGLRSLHDGLGTVALALTVYAAIGRPNSNLVWEAMGLAAIALALGLTLRRASDRLRSSRGMVMVIHALVGGTGALILAATALG